MPFISCHIVGNITNIPLGNITRREEYTQEARSKNFLDTRARKTTCCPSLSKLKGCLWPQHATNWAIICINWAEHRLIGKSIQRDMLNKASRQDARPIQLDPKFLIQEVVGKGSWWKWWKSWNSAAVIRKKKKGLCLGLGLFLYLSLSHGMPFQEAERMFVEWFSVKCELIGTNWD